MTDDVRRVSTADALGAHVIGRKVYGAFALTAVLPAVVIVACYGPTQVRIAISTDVPCRLEEPRLQTDIRVGASFTTLRPETTAYSCIGHQGADSEIGSLVMVPSGDHDGRVSGRPRQRRDVLRCHRHARPHRQERECGPPPGLRGWSEARRLPTHAYAYGPAPDGTIKRHPLPWSAVVGFTLAYDGALRFVAPADGGVIITTGGVEPSLKRIDNAAMSPTFLQSAITPGAVAVQGKDVFYVETGADAGINAGIVKTVDTTTPDKVMVAAGFSTIQGLVVDDACVYFWGAKGHIGVERHPPSVQRSGSEYVKRSRI